MDIFALKDRAQELDLGHRVIEPDPTWPDRDAIAVILARQIQCPAPNCWQRLGPLDGDYCKNHAHLG